MDGQGSAATAAAAAAVASAGAAGTTGAATPKYGHGQRLHLPVQLLQLFLLFP